MIELRRCLALIRHDLVVGGEGLCMMACPARQYLVRKLLLRRNHAILVQVLVLRWVLLVATATCRRDFHYGAPQALP